MSQFSHYCNAPLRCPTCIRRFWAWAQQHTRGRVPKGEDGKRATRPIDPDTTPSFYEAAGKFADVDHRAKRMAEAADCY